MEWIERLNDTISYIEEHLTEEIDMNQLGRIACCSSYHFQRMFTYMAGGPPAEYSRRRKMSPAPAGPPGRGWLVYPSDPRAKLTGGLMSTRHAL